MPKTSMHEPCLSIDFECIDMREGTPIEGNAVMNATTYEPIDNILTVYKGASSAGVENVGIYCKVER